MYYDTYFYYLDLYYRSIARKSLNLFVKLEDTCIDFDEETAFLWAVNLIEEKQKIFTDFRGWTDITVIDLKLIDLLIDRVQFRKMSNDLYDRRAKSRRHFLRGKRDNWFAISKFNEYGFVPMDEDYLKLF